MALVDFVVTGVSSPNGGEAKTVPHVRENPKRVTPAEYTWYDEALVRLRQDRKAVCGVVYARSSDNPAKATPARSA